MNAASAAADGGPDPSSRGPNFDSTTLASGASRDAVRASHPLTTDGIQIATPSVRAVYSEAIHVIERRLPGTNFVADPRSGKTRAIEILKRMLAINYPKIPVGDLIAVEHDRSSEAKLWGDMAESLDLTSTSARENSKARNKIMNLITTQCSALGSNIYVMLSDEVQNWGEPEWSHIKDLSNLLRSKGIVYVHLGFGQLSLYDVRSRLNAASRKDLVRRFLSDIYAMKGISEEKDLRSALQQLDDPKYDYPTGSRICYAEFFMPQAFGGGWRIAGESVRLWAALNIVSRQLVQAPASNVGMSSVILAIKEFFSLCESQDEKSFTGTSTHWLSAVKRSGYSDELSP